MLREPSSRMCLADRFLVDQIGNSDYAASAVTGRPARVAAMKKMRSAWLGLGLVVLAAASCGSPRPSEPADGGGGTDGSGGPVAVNLELLAGDLGGPGSVDGVGAAAHFNHPADVAVDSAGNVYVADTANHTLRKVTADGVVTTLAGTAGMFGTGLAARFRIPLGVAVDSTGNVYVADQFNSTIRKVTPAGIVTTLAGTPGRPGSGDGAGPAVRFNFPTGVAVDSAGNVYVADQLNNTIRKITTDGVVTTLAGTLAGGSADGTGAAASFSFPTDVAVDGAGNVYVADQFNNTLRKVTAAGVVTTLAGTAGMSGTADGTGPAARFNSPTGVAVDSTGNVYVADQNNYTLRKVTAAGVVTTLAGTAGMFGTADGTGPAARFDFPTGVAADSAGNVYVADKDTLRKVTPAGVVTTLAGTPA
jgi:sugar lactone lactonase YvrE